MKSCCVEGCHGPSTPNPVFFEFPSSRLLRKRWLDAIKCSSVEADAVVCIIHFAPGDYELAGTNVRLKSRAVPTRRIGGEETEDEDSDSESSDSSESAISERIQDKTQDGTTNNKDNEKAHKDNEDNDKIHTDIRNNVINHKEHGDNQIAHSNSENHENVENSQLSQTSDFTVNEPVDKEESLVEKVSEKCNGRLDNQCNGIVNNDNDRVEDYNIDKNNEKVVNDNENVVKDKDKVGKDKEKVDKDHEIIDKDIEKVSKDNGNNETVQVRKAKFKITARRPVNGRRRRKMSTDSSSLDSVSSSPPRRPELEGSKEDIEDSLQHYYIENKKTERQVAAMADVLIKEQEKRDEEFLREMQKEEGSEGAFDPATPVFIELSVGQGSTREGQGAVESDCLMLLESVQCDVDPTLLLAAREEDEANMEQVDLEDDDDDDDELEVIENKKEDPISLLTSSDEDDVIIQEPKIDTVEVSSADTSEDDMPLVKLVKTPTVSETSKLLNTKRAKNLITQLLWGRNDFYCVHCRYTTANPSEYTKHMSTHSKVIQMCHDCGFTTSSKHQLQRHKMKHKNEKRFRCHMCNYSAKHKMSLVYHMKTHNATINEVELAICGTYEPASKTSRMSEKSGLSERSGLSEKSRSSGKRKKSKKSRLSDAEKRYKCDSCDYKTDRRSDLKRHRNRIHGDEGNDDDDEYVP